MTRVTSRLGAVHHNLLMDSKEYLDLLKQAYSLVSVLSDKNGAKVLRMRNCCVGKDLIVKHYISPVVAYEKLKHFKHPNLSEIYDTVLLSDGQIVLEEFIDGISVAQVLQCGKYTYRGACQVLRGVCAAVGALHDMGIIHRDIKPENVMLTKSGTVKLIDLNATRQLVPNKDADTVILGTIGYAPPEQYGIGQSNARTDIYALGVLLNVMLTGEHPSKQLAKGKAGKIVQKCTLIDPDSRYPSVNKLIEAL